MDGLMLDTERVDLEHFLRVGSEFGYTDLEATYRECIGSSWKDTEVLFFRRMGAAFPFEEIRERWGQESARHVEEVGVACKSGLLELLAQLEAMHIPKAVATSTKRRRALRLLERAGLAGRFDAIVAGDEVTHGKPHPEIYLAAAERLGVTPRACVAFEDSPHGLRAAYSAGMLPVLVPDLISPSPETAAMAHCVLESLNDALALLPLWRDPNEE